MRMTIRLPDDLHEKVAVDALKKPHNSKEAVIAEILRAHYGGADRDAKIRGALGWSVDEADARGIRFLRERAKKHWK